MQGHYPRQAQLFPIICAVTQKRTICVCFFSCFFPAFFFFFFSSSFFLFFFFRAFFPPLSAPRPIPLHPLLILLSFSHALPATLNRLVKEDVRVNSLLSEVPGM